MKLKKSLVASILAAGLTGSALANTVVYVHVVGAPAFRQNSNDAIQAIVNTHSGAGLTATSASTITYGVGNSVESAKANQWLIPNYSTGVDLVINASYPGSTAAIESVASAGAGGVTQKFIADGTGTVAVPTAGAGITSVLTPDNTWIALPDTYQASTIFNGNLKLYSNAAHTTSFTHNYQTLGATQIGVEPYRWVVGPGSPASFTNITAGQAQQLYANGSLPLSFFTGSSADEGKTVYALSRDGGSGARIGALTEIGYELPGSEVPIVTFKPVVTGGSVDSAGSNVSGTIASGTPPFYPAGQIPSTGVWDSNVGDAGYPSFGTTDQAGELLAVTSTPPAGALYVAYLNIADSTEATAAGAKVLTYNGVAYSTAAVAEGNYTFWAYEWLDTPASQSTAAASFSTALANQFPSNAAVPVTTLNVSRQADGGVITQNY